MWGIILGLIVIIGLIFTFLIIISPGTSEQLKDSQGNVIAHSISEKTKLTIGGVKQGVFILGENVENPVLLFLHGGPGSPELPLVFTNDGSPRLEEEFTVCYWDQRGAGMSFTGKDAVSMTLEQLVADTLEVTRYLQDRFKQKKIFIMGHSWGTYLGTKVLQQHPEDFIAYIGMGQISNQLLSEKLAYDYMLEHAQQLKDPKAIKGLEKYSTSSLDFPSLSYMQTTRSSLMNKYGIGLTHVPISMIIVLKEILFFKGYTLTEKIGYFRGLAFSSKTLFHTVLKDDLALSSTSFEVPIYIIQGKFDYQVSYQLAQEYTAKISAPKKAFFTFEQSAHSPIFEEREKFMDTMKHIKNECY